MRLWRILYTFHHNLPIYNQMKQPFVLVAAVCLAAIQPSMAQVKRVEEVTKKGDELVIPYEKFILPNGLTLVVHEDHSDPIVHVDVTYHVGSAREEIGKSGFAHFFDVFEVVLVLLPGGLLALLRQHGDGALDVA